MASLLLDVRIAGPTRSAVRDPIGAALLERYVSYRGDPPSRTEIEHSPWVIQPLEVERFEAHGLLPEGARLAAAHFGTPRVASVSAPHAMPAETAAWVAEPA
jgi:hypothetical protein